MSLIGTLGEIKIEDVLRMLAAGQKSGLLTISGTGQQALLRFQKGAVVHAAAGRLLGEDAVLDLFGWTQGQLVFVAEEGTVTANVDRSVEELVLEGGRRGARLHQMHQVMSSDRVVFQMGPGPAAEDAFYNLGSTAWRVLRLVDGVRDLRELVEGSRLPQREVMRILFDLHEAGLLERVEPVRTGRLRVQGSFLFGGKETAELDARLETDWKRLLRFQGGVHRIELRTHGGLTAQVAVAFRDGLGKDINVSRAVLAQLAAQAGEEVQIRPIA